MRQYILFLLLPLITCCSSDIFDHPQGNVSLGQVSISLTGIGDDERAGFDISLRNLTTNSQFTAKTQSDGRVQPDSRHLRGQCFSPAQCRWLCLYLQRHFRPDYRSQRPADAGQH